MEEEGGRREEGGGRREEGGGRRREEGGGKREGGGGGGGVSCLPTLLCSVLLAFALAVLLARSPACSQLLLLLACSPACSQLLWCGVLLCYYEGEGGVCEVGCPFLPYPGATLMPGLWCVGTCYSPFLPLQGVGWGGVVDGTWRWCVQVRWWG
jgi:hypothetical protein